MINTIAGIFQDGGVFMYPIVIVLAIGVAISIERYQFLNEMSITNRRVWENITPFIRAGKFQEAVFLTSNSKSVIGQILTYGLHRIRPTASRDVLENAMEESLMEIVPMLEKRTHYLATFATISALLGLLGTIVGLFKAFTIAMSAASAEQTNLLMANISVTMITMAFGLMVAIPLLLLHTFLQSKTTNIIDSLEIASVKFLNAVDERRALAKAEGQPA
jgi:biopolymer transport protein ExbB/TolQ